MNYYNDYDDYCEDANAQHEQAIEDVLEMHTEVVKDKNCININIKEDMLQDVFEQTLNKYCKEQAESIKVEAIASIKKQLIDEKFDKILEEELSKSIKEKTDLLMNNFMDREITISSGYYDTKKTTCKQLIEADIETFLKKDLNGNFKKSISEMIDYRTEKKIKDYETSLRNEVTHKIDDLFNQTTKNALSENLFYILSQNETYQKLATNINGLIENKK